MAGFTDEEVAHLAANPNVASVKNGKIQFTSAFKLRAWEEKRQGKRIKEIFRENGFDPDVLGRKRIENFSLRLNEDVRAGHDLTDRRANNGRPVSGTDVEKMSLEERVRWLTHELEYAKQEVEFLKKLQMANTEARKEWESKHQRG